MAEASLLDHLSDEDPNRKLSEKELEVRSHMLAALGLELAELRTEAISGRHQTGIEDEWAEDEEFYEGIDDINRGEHGAWRSKPPGQMAIGDEGEDDGANRGSTIFFNMTSSYVDAASARVADMLLPTDDRGWALKPTPVPELIDIAKARVNDSERDEIESQYTDDPNRETAIILELGGRVRKKFPRDLQSQIDRAPQLQGDNQDMAVAKAQTYIDLADEVGAEIDKATKKAQAAERRIEDWHVECQYQRQMRQVIEDAARIGTGVLKGPIPLNKRHVAYKGGQLLVENALKPVSLRVDPWNCFPDPGCGDSIHDGSYHWERADITPKALAALRDQPLYIAEQINEVLDEGPHEASRIWKEEKSQFLGLSSRDKKNLYEIWYGYVNLTREQCDAAGVDLPEEMGEHPFVPCAVTMVNNHVIKANINILDTGEFPYDYMVWQRRSEIPYGRGVARQGRTAQRVVNAAARNMMDNAGLAGGPMWAFLDEVLVPLDGIFEIRPRKGWAINAAASKEQLENAFRYFDMPMMQAELEKILQIGLKMFEDVTGLPMLLQGQMGSAPDTVGGMQMLNNNASSVMRRIARLFDDLVTEPHVRRYYTYLLRWGEDDEEKGEFVVDARGSSALVERDLNNQGLQQMGAMILNPVFKKDPAKWMDEYMRGMKLDPKRIEYEDEEWQKVVEGLAAAGQKGDSSVEVAQIRGEAALQVQQLRNQNDDMDRELEKARLTLQEQRDEADRAIAAQREESDRQLQIAFQALKKELDELTIASGAEDTDKKIKADLAKSIMGIEAQFAMQRNETPTEVATPTVEPPGRAPAGEAFQR